MPCSILPKLLAWFAWIVGILSGAYVDPSMIQCASRLLLGRVGPGGVREGKSPSVVKTILLHFGVMAFYAFLINSGLLLHLKRAP